MNWEEKANKLGLNIKGVNKYERIDCPEGSTLKDLLDKFANKPDEVFFDDCITINFTYLEKPSELDYKNAVDNHIKKVKEQMDAIKALDT